MTYVLSIVLKYSNLLMITLRRYSYIQRWEMEGRRKGEKEREREEGDRKREK